MKKGTVRSKRSPKRPTAIKYSLVIPALEEELLIGSTLTAVHAYLSKHDVLASTEVIVVTANSKDRTAEIVRTGIKRFPHGQFIEPGPRRGKGRDVKAGILAAKGDYILFTDADLATPVHHIIPAFALLENGADVVIGERRLPDIHTGFRKFVSLAANRVTRLLVATAFPDTQCGFKGFTRESAQRIFSILSVNGWAFDMEVIAIAVQNGLRIEALVISDWAEHKPDDKQLSGENSMKAAAKTMGEALAIGRKRALRQYKKP